MKGLSSGLRAPMYPYVAPHTSKIHTLITLGIRNRTKPLVLKARKHRPCGFDSHRPLHFSLPGVSLRCPGTRLSLSPSSHSLDVATTVPLIEGVNRPSVEFVLDGLIRPTSLRIVRRLPACAQLSKLVEPGGQGLGNPRGRKPRERADEVSGGDGVWGFERRG
jgi:hypothetical protein